MFSNIEYSYFGSNMNRKRHLSIQTGHADAGTLILLASVLLSPLGSGGLTAKPAHPRSDEERSIQAAQ